MTSDDRDLTANAQDGDLTLAAIVRSLVEAAARFGLDRDTLLHRIGLTPRDLEDPDGLVSLEAYVSAWELIAAEPGFADFGLRLGALASPRFLGALGYAMIHAPDALAAVRMFHRFRRLMSDTLAPDVDIQDEYVTYRRLWPARFARLVHFAAEWLQLSIQRHVAQMGSGMPNCAFDAKDVRVSVESGGTGFAVKITGKDTTQAKEILSRAQLLVN